MQRSPEAIIASMLGLKEYMIGNVLLSTDTNSVLFDENLNPRFLSGQVNRHIQFDVVSKDRSKLEEITARLDFEASIGSLAIVAITGDYVRGYGYWKFRVDGRLLRSPETAELFNSFGRL